MLLQCHESRPNMPKPIPRRFCPHPTNKPMKNTSPIRQLAFLSLFCACIVLSSERSAAQSGPAAVAQQLQQRYASLESLQATFNQQVADQRIAGTLKVQGAAFRLDLSDQALVTDGTTLWSYSQTDEQLVIQNYEPGDVGFSVGQLFTNYLDVFRATGATKATIGDVQHDVLTLVPREQGMSVQDVTLYVRSSDAIPTRVRVHDTSGQTLAFDLSSVQRNPRFPSSTFRMTAPTGVEVIDLR